MESSNRQAPKVTGTQKKAFARPLLGIDPIHFGIVHTGLVPCTSPNSIPRTFCDMPIEAKLDLRELTLCHGFFRGFLTQQSTEDLAFPCHTKPSNQSTSKETPWQISTLHYCALSYLAPNPPLHLASTPEYLSHRKKECFNIERQPRRSCRCQSSVQN